MKCAYVIAGHAVVNGKGTGAFGLGGFDEAKQALRLRDAVTSSLIAMNVKVYNENPSLDLTKVISWLKSVVKENDLVIEFHFNVGPSSAKGIETFVDDTYSEVEFKLARSVSLAVQKATGDILRGNSGVKKESESQHKRLAILSDVKAVNLLVEFGFISNKDFVKNYEKNFDKIVEYVSLEIRNYCIS